MPTQKLAPCCRRHTVNGQEQLVIETAEGQRITLSGGATTVTIEDSLGNWVQFGGGTVTVRAVGTILLQAATVEVVASQITLNSPTVLCSGVLQADTVIANTVAAASYTPGTGNVW
ncbi:MAG TPA: hypothetical protein VE779_13780 [Candidatus Angelobacter sp.]|nr:hypothetical protein [Candidatus Angelobacter sp.]